MRAAPPPLRKLSTDSIKSVDGGHVLCTCKDRDEVGHSHSHAHVPATEAMDDFHPQSSLRRGWEPAPDSDSEPEQDASSNTDRIADANQSDQGSMPLYLERHVAVMICLIDAALDEYARALMDPVKGIPLGKRRLRLTTYNQCFSGTDAAGWFMANMEGVTTVEYAKVT
jgi:hypothetical protein